MTTSVSAYQSLQKVQATEQNAYWNSTLLDNALRASDRTIPFIFSGLHVSLDSASGIATISAGSVQGDKFDSSDDPLILSDIYPLSQTTSPTTVSVTSTGEEFGYIVLTQSLTPRSGIVNEQAATTGFDVTVTLNYRPGTDTYYPNRINHDIILAGVHTTDGGNYILTSGVGQTSASTSEVLRDEDKDDYYQSIRQRVLSADPNFYPWINTNNTPVTLATVGTAPITSIWTLELTTGSTASITATPASFDDTNIPIGGSSATTYINLTNSVASPSGACQIFQTQDSLSKFANQWVRAYARIKLNSASDTVSIQAQINAIEEYTSDIVALSAGTEFVDIPLGAFYLDTQKIIDNGTTFTNPITINQIIKIISTGTYNLDTYGIYFVNGRNETVPQEPLIDQRAINAAVLLLKEQLASETNPTGSSLVGTNGLGADETVQSAFARLHANTGAGLINTTQGTTVQAQLNAHDDFAVPFAYILFNGNNNTTLKFKNLSFSRPSTGQYNFSFGTNAPSADYLISMTDGEGTGNVQIAQLANQSAGGFQIKSWTDGNGTDRENLGTTSVIIWVV